MNNIPDIDKISEKLDLPDNVRDQALYLFQNAAGKNILRGRSAENILGGSIYTACRVTGCPRKFSEISEVLNLEEKKLYRGYKHLARNLDINIPPINPEDYLPRLASILDLDPEVEEKALNIIKKANQNGLSSGKCPFGMAAAAVYIAGQLEEDRKAQKEIKEAAHVSEITVRNRIKDIVKELNNEFDFCKKLERSLSL